MTGLVERLLSVDPVVAYGIVALLVFAEDALFVGFVLPGETAAVLGGVDASRGHVDVVLMAGFVVLAAVVGDSVGYEVGRHLGPRMLTLRPLRRRQDQLQRARDHLARRGGPAVFLARFVAFLRAVMPALAGTSHMPYARFLAYNAVGGLAWGIGCVVLGDLAGNSYHAVERTAGRAVALAVAAVAVLALVIWKIRTGRAHRP